MLIQKPFPKRQVKNLEIFPVSLRRPPKDTRKSEEHIVILLIVSQHFRTSRPFVLMPLFSIPHFRGCNLYGIVWEVLDLISDHYVVVFVVAKSLWTLKFQASFTTSQNKQ
jgi:hypothetical protein